MPPLDEPQIQVVPKRPSRAPQALGTVAIIGLGYVGLPLLLLARERGWRTHGIDIDDERLGRIRAQSVPDLDPAYDEFLKREVCSVSSQFGAVRDADIVCICVPTPVDDTHEPDLGPVEGAVRKAARFFKPGQLVALESTVNPGTTEEVLVPLIEEVSGLVVGRDIEVAHCPERVNPGDPHWPIERIPRVVGATSRRGLERSVAFYRSILSAEVREMASIKEAEAVKMVENCFRDINIAFVNELAMSFTMLGIDIAHVLEGAATKPFGFMPHSPGCGVGGHCIPVDPYYLIRYAKQRGFDHQFLSLARSINNGMPAFTVSLLEAELLAVGIPLKEATVLVLGLSYKAGISDLRESPAFHIIDTLKAKGATVRTFDPYTPERSTHSSLESALSGAEGVIVATAHTMFRALTPRDFAQHHIAALVDGRNCLDKQAFTGSPVRYRGIGR